MSVVIIYSILFRKIDRMRSSADKEWTEKLQPAVLSVNTEVKRSTGHTAFYLIFGRDYDNSSIS